MKWWLLAAGMFLAPSGGLCAQDAETVTGIFYDAVAAHRWEAAALTLHPEALALFRLRLASMLGADPDGALQRLVFRDTQRPFAERSDLAVFAALLRAIEADIPALISVLATNDYDPIGHLLEGPSLVHVLLRVTPYTNGSAPSRTAVVTLKRTDSGWGILESGELDSLSTAMTGLSITAKMRGL